MKLTLVLLSFLLVPILALAQTQAKTEEAYSNVDAHVAKKLENPVYQMVFDQIQGTLLRTNIDLTISQFFDNSPFIQSVRPHLQDQLLQDTRLEIQRGNIAMTPITDNDPNPVHQSLLKAFRKKLRNSGMPEAEVMASNLLLALGDVNAYTNTGRRGQHLIFIQSGLVDKILETRVVTLPGGVTFPRDQLIEMFAESIFAHEIGHIKSSHVTLGIENSAYLFQVLKYFVDPKDQISEDQEDSLHVIPHGNNKSHKESEAQTKPLRKALTSTAKKVQAMLQRSEGDDAKMRVILLDYVEMVIRAILQNGEMDPQVLKTLVDLRTAKPGSIRAKTLLAAFGPAMKLLSREWETSADMHILINTEPLWAAAPFVMFTGATRVASTLDPNFLPSIEYQIYLHIQRNADLYKDATLDTQIQLLGNSSGDHPFEGQRIDNILHFSRTLDVTATQNRLVMMFLTYSGLLQAQHMAHANQESIKDEIEKMKAAAKAKGLSDQDISKIAAKVQDISANQAEVEKQAKDLAASTARDVVTFMTQAGFSGASLKDNQLFTDVIDFQLARKTRNLLTQQKIADAINKTSDKNEKVFLTDLLKNFAYQFGEGDVVIDEVRSEILKIAKNNDNNIFLAKANQVLDPKLTVESARAARTEIVTALGEKDSIKTVRGRSAVGLEDSDVSQSSLKGRYLPADQILARQQELEKIAAGDRVLNPDKLPTSTIRCDQRLAALFRKRP